MTNIRLNGPGAVPASRSSGHLPRTEAGRLQQAEIERIIAARIRHRRVTMNLSIADFAERIGISCEQAERYDTGRERVAPEDLIRIATAFRTDLSWFFHGLGLEQEPMPDGPGRGTAKRSLKKAFEALTKAARSSPTRDDR